MEHVLAPHSLIHSFFRIMAAVDAIVVRLLAANRLHPIVPHGPISYNDNVNDDDDELNRREGSESKFSPNFLPVVPWSVWSNEKSRKKMPTHPPGWSSLRRRRAVARWSVSTVSSSSTLYPFCLFLFLSLLLSSPLSLSSFLDASYLTARAYCPKRRCSLLALLLTSSISLSLSRSKTPASNEAAPSHFSKL